jgi:excisionase family DNA binding protein
MKEKPQIIARWPRLLCVEDAAEYLNISPKTIRNGLAKNAPSPFPVMPKRFGKRVLFDIQDLDRYVDDLPRG